VIQLWIGVKVFARMLVAAAPFETAFIAGLAVVAIAIWFEWKYRHEKRTQRKPPAKTG
jgi:membrane protein implicated in regulation of membrane protease activity